MVQYYANVSQIGTTHWLDLSVMTLKEKPKKFIIEETSMTE